MPSPPPESHPRNPYVFVVGCPRSGTTLLQRMLDSHPRLAVANDTHFIPRAVKRLPEAGDYPLTPELVEAVRTYRRFPRLGLTDGEVDAAAAQADTYRAFVGNLYGRFAAKQGKPLGGEKTPDYARSLSRLYGLFPWARFVHIIRDGRDVALSTLSWAEGKHGRKKGPARWALWEDEPVGCCALWWRWQVTSGRADGSRLGEAHYLELIYEDLVAAPEPELRRVARFLGLQFDAQMLSFYQGKTRPNPKLSAKSAWLPPTRGLRDWRTEMDEREVALFEALAGDLLVALGYPLRFDAVPQGVRQAAERCRRWWADQHPECGVPAREARALEEPGSPRA